LEGGFGGIKLTHGPSPLLGGGSLDECVLWTAAFRLTQVPTSVSTCNGDQNLAVNIDYYCLKTRRGILHSTQAPALFGTPNWENKVLVPPSASQNRVNLPDNPLSQPVYHSIQNFPHKARYHHTLSRPTHLNLLPLNTLPLQTHRPDQRQTGHGDTHIPRLSQGIIVRPQHTGQELLGHGFLQRGGAEL
jgi:hypothetical protein